MDLSFTYDAFYYEDLANESLQVISPHRSDSGIDGNSTVSTDPIKLEPPQEKEMSNIAGKPVLGKAACHPLMEDIYMARKPETPPQSDGPRTRRFKAKARTLSAKEWEPYKIRILELHRTRKLKEVKKVMEAEFGFVAEIRQYRRRISDWGRDKNIKSSEMKAVVRKRQIRRVREPHKNPLRFRVRGVAVESTKIDRWMKRNKVSEDSLYDAGDGTDTLSVISCFTANSAEGTSSRQPLGSTRHRHRPDTLITQSLARLPTANPSLTSLSARLAEASISRSPAAADTSPIPAPLDNNNPPTEPSDGQSPALDSLASLTRWSTNKRHAKASPGDDAAADLLAYPALWSRNTRCVESCIQKGSGSCQTILSFSDTRPALSSFLRNGTSPTLPLFSDRWPLIACNPETDTIPAILQCI